MNSIQNYILATRIILYFILAFCRRFLFRAKELACPTLYWAASYYLLCARLRTRFAISGSDKTVKLISNFIGYCNKDSLPSTIRGMYMFSTSVQVRNVHHCSTSLNSQQCVKTSVKRSACTRAFIVKHDWINDAHTANTQLKQESCRNIKSRSYTKIYLQIYFQICL